MVFSETIMCLVVNCWSGICCIATPTCVIDLLSLQGLCKGVNENVTRVLQAHNRRSSTRPQRFENSKRIRHTEVTSRYHFIKDMSNGHVIIKYVESKKQSGWYDCKRLK